MTAWLVLGAGWAWAHPAFTAAYALGVLFALWMLCLVMLTEDGGAPRRAAQGAPDLTAPLPCVQHTAPYNPEHLEWASRYAEHRERQGNPITLHGLLHHQYPLNVPGPASAPTLRAGDQLAVLLDEMAGEQ